MQGPPGGGATGHADKPIVLVVDDEYLVCMHLVDALVTAHFHVVEARNGEEALDVLNATSVDVVITDRRMPGLVDGDILCELVAERLPHVPVLMMSAERPAPRETQAIVEFFPKPIDVRAVIALVARLVTRSPVCDSNQATRLPDAGPTRAGRSNCPGVSG